MRFTVIEKGLLKIFSKITFPYTLLLELETQCWPIGYPISMISGVHLSQSTPHAAQDWLLREYDQLSEAYLES